MEKSLDTLKSRVASLEVVEAERDKMVNENKHLSEEMERYTELQVCRLIERSMKKKHHSKEFDRTINSYKSMMFIRYGNKNSYI